MGDLSVHCREPSTQTTGLAPISRARQHLECFAIWFLVDILRPRCQSQIWNQTVAVIYLNQLYKFVSLNRRKPA